MRTIETTVFTFDELSDQAKEKARAWFRDGQLDYDWYDSAYEDAETIGKIFGIEMDRKRNSTTPAIWFSGFYSQGDGACFEGRWECREDAGAKIREYAPQDSTLHEIGDALAGYKGCSARVKHRGHYYHSLCTEIDVGEPDEEEITVSVAHDDVRETLREFMQWIYVQLEKECEWLQADEQVDESIRANGYEFEEDGTRA